MAYIVPNLSSYRTAPAQLIRAVHDVQNLRFDLSDKDKAVLAAIAKGISVADKVRESSSLILEITPAAASEILRHHNKDNRAMRAHNIARIVGGIERSQWFLTGDTIKFSSKGQLLDGQNRLCAAIIANKSIKTHVVFGIPPEAFRVLDQGARRTAADVLHVAGYKNTITLAAAAGWTMATEAVNRREMHIRQKFYPSPYEVLDLLQSSIKDLPKYADIAFRVHHTTRLAPSVLMGLSWSLARASTPAECEAFMDAWSANNSQHYPAIGALNQRINAIRSGTGGHIPSAMVYALTIKAWNMSLRRNKVALGDLIWKKDEWFPKIETKVGKHKKAA